MRSRRMFTAAALLVAAMTVTACSTTTGGTTATPAAGVNAPPTATAATTARDSGASSSPVSSSTASSPATTPSRTPTPPSTTAVTDQAVFGETYAWADGLEVTVSAPEPFKPSEYAVTDNADDTYLSFTVTIVNKTGKKYEPALFIASVQSGDREGEQIFDSENGFSGTPSTAILNGRQSTFTIGFSASDAKDIVMEVRPGFDYDSAYFTSSATAEPAQEATSPTGTPPRSPSNSQSSRASDQAVFGETYAWADGLEVTVSAPEPFKPSEYAVTDNADDTYLSFTVTIVNKTGKKYEPALFIASVQSGDREGEQIFDSENGFSGTPSTAILNGRQSTFTIGFSASDAKDIVMEVRPGFDYDSAYFTS